MEALIALIQWEILPNHLLLLDKKKLYLLTSLEMLDQVKINKVIHLNLQIISR